LNQKFVSLSTMASNVDTERFLVGRKVSGKNQ
jgi:hypothetical protein